MKKYIVAIVVIVTFFVARTSFAQEKECTLMADLDCSDAVNILDLNTLLSKFGSEDVLADLNNSGRVNAADLTVMITQFGRKAAVAPLPTSEAPRVVIPTSEPGDTRGARTNSVQSSTFGDILE